MKPHPSTRPHAFTALRQIAGTLNAAWDLSTTLNLIADKTTEVMHVDSCSIYLLDPDGDTLRLQATTGLARQAVGRATLRVGEGMTGVAVVAGEPQFAADAQADPRYKLVEGTREAGFISLLAVPLLSNERIIGALNVQTLAAHEFSAAESEILALIGDLVAGALARAQHHDQQQAQLQELQALAQVSEAVTSPLYLGDMLDVVTEMAGRMMAAAVCTIFLLDESGQYLEMRSARQRNNPFQKRPPQAVDAGILGQVFNKGQALFVPDVLQEPRFTNQEMAAAEGLVGMLCEPLRVRERVIGVLACYTNEQRDFSQKEVALFATLANQTALAIENTQLATNAAIVREMHHRIKNNLQSVAMLMQMQIPEAGQLDTEQVLQTNISRIRTIAAVHEVLSERGFHLVDVKAVLTHITHMTAQTMMPPGADITVVVQGEAIQLPSRAATNLALVVNELLQNALAHGFAGITIGNVLISLGSSAEEVIVLVRDDGRGMPASASFGLGLTIAETLVTQDLRGRFKINRLRQGTEFSLRIPKDSTKDPMGFIVS